MTQARCKRHAPMLKSNACQKLLHSLWSRLTRETATSWEFQNGWRSGNQATRRNKLQTRDGIRKKMPKALQRTQSNNWVGLRLQASSALVLKGQPRQNPTFLNLKKLVFWLFTQLLPSPERCLELKKLPEISNIQILRHNDSWASSRNINSVLLRIRFKWNNQTELLEAPLRLSSHVPWWQHRRATANRTN